MTTTVSDVAAAKARERRIYTPAETLPREGLEALQLRKLKKLLEYNYANNEFYRDLWKKHGGKMPPGKVLIKDRIADAMFQQLLLRPDEYSVIATPNLNGDYISDAAAAQVGGLGIAPGGNVGDGVAVFEATHGTAPKYAGLDKINPGSVILSGVMMFEYLGWDDVGRLIVKGLENAIRSKRVTYDLARQMPGATEVSTSAFADQIIKGMSA